MKKTLASLLLILVLALSLTSVLASSAVHVRDSAGLLNSEEEADLDAKLAEIAGRYGMDVLILTVDSYPGYFIDDFCEDYFTEHDRGLGAKGDGIILAVCMQTREYYECTHGRAVSLFTNADLIRMENRFVPKLSEGNYYRAFEIFANRVRAALFWEQLLGGQGSAVFDFVHANRDELVKALIIGFSVGLVIALIRTAVLVGKLKSVKPINHAENYAVPASFRLTDKQEVFTHKTVDRTERYQDRDSGGSGGGGFSGGGGGGGGSFGGHGGHF